MNRTSRATAVVFVFSVENEEYEGPGLKCKNLGTKRILAIWRGLNPFKKQLRSTANKAATSSIFVL